MGGRSGRRAIRFDEVAEEEEADRRFFDREVGREAMSPGRTKTNFELLEGRYFEEGNRLALLECVMLARRKNALLPRWALNALADAFAEFLKAGAEGNDERTLDALLLNPDAREGRHANPLTRERERLRRRRQLDIIDEVIAEGLKGEVRDDEIGRRLIAARVALAPETIRSYAATRVQKRKAVDRHWDRWLRLLGMTQSPLDIEDPKKGNKPT